jgi:hypothetical protein
MKIKITRTSVVEYAAKDGDLVYYWEQEALNNDQIALRDKEGLEADELEIEDLDGGSVEHTYEVVLVNDDGTEREPDVNDRERDNDLFPESFDEPDEDVDDEKPVAGDLNAGSII